MVSSCPLFGGLPRIASHRKRNYLMPAYQKLPLPVFYVLQIHQDSFRNRAVVEIATAEPLNPIDVGDCLYEVSFPDPPPVRDSREPGSNTAPELLWRGLRGNLDQNENLSSVSPVDPDITPIPLVISGLSVQFFTNGGVTPARQPGSR